MRLFFCAILGIATTVFISACTRSPAMHMLVKDQPWQDIRSVVPEYGKSALVIAALHRNGFDFKTYLDKKMIGVTKWRDFFTKTDVSPGTHYLMTKAENMETIKIQFEPNRTYYVLQIARPGIMRSQVTLSLDTPEDILKVWDEGVNQLEYNAKDMGEDLTDHEYDVAIREYEKYLREGYYKDHQGYKGVSSGMQH